MVYSAQIRVKLEMDMDLVDGHVMHMHECLRRLE
jgi:hypothetical protein